LYVPTAYWWLLWVEESTGGRSTDITGTTTNKIGLEVHEKKTKFVMVSQKP